MWRRAGLGAALVATLWWGCSADVESALSNLDQLRDVVALQPSEPIRAMSRHDEMTPQGETSDPGWEGSFAHSGRTTAVIEGTDRGQGVLIAGGQRFRAHPEQLRSLVPGQLVTIDFVEVQGVWWVVGLSEVRPEDFI